MKKVTVIMMILALGVMFTNTLSAQELSRKEKLNQLNQEIAKAQTKKTKGILHMTTGIGLFALGYVAFAPEYERLPNNDPSDAYYTDDGTETDDMLFFTCVGSGVIIALMGTYELINGTHTLSKLKKEKASISFAPTIFPNGNGNINYALTLNVKL